MIKIEQLKNNDREKKNEKTFQQIKIVDYYQQDKDSYKKNQILTVRQS